MRRLLAAGALLLASACAGSLSPTARLQDDVANLIDRANVGDVPGVHDAAGVLASDVRTELGKGQITAGKARALLALVAAVENEAESLTTSPTPTAAPTTQAPSPTTSPTPSPTPSPTAKPTPSPTPVVVPTTVPPSATASATLGLGSSQTPAPSASG